MLEIFLNYDYGCLCEFILRLPIADLENKTYGVENNGEGRDILQLMHIINDGRRIKVNPNSLALGHAELHAT